MLELVDLQYANMHRINITVNSGECVSLSGSSGSGKTRLLRAIVDLDVHGGQVICNSVQQDAIPAHEWRQQVGYLPAESVWWLDKVREHFSVVDQTMLQALSLKEMMLDEVVSHLSSGERQRLALFRLLSLKPKVLLLDEPTANLDEDNRTAVENLISSYRQKNNVAVIWVGHDSDQLDRVASRHFVIDVDNRQVVQR